MTHALSRGRITPREMGSTELKSRMMDAWDDARAGHVVIITRNGRPIAGIVPVEVALAYEANADLPEHLRLEMAAAVSNARAEIGETLHRLAMAVEGQQPAESTAGDQPDDAAKESHA